MVSKVRTTVTLDEHVLKAVKVKAARMGKGDSELIEEALRRDLGLDVLDRLWIVNDMTEEEATSLAVEAQHETRKNLR
jgi:metal-responsive CopG/Arc/MetJ family transcriptional regulator